MSAPLVIVIVLLALSLVVRREVRLRREQNHAIRRFREQQRRRAFEASSARAVTRTPE